MARRPAGTARRPASPKARLPVAASVRKGWRTVSPRRPCRHCRRRCTRPAAARASIPAAPCSKTPDPETRLGRHAPVSRLPARGSRRRGSVIPGKPIRLGGARFGRAPLPVRSRFGRTPGIRSWPPVRFTTPSLPSATRATYSRSRTASSGCGCRSRSRSTTSTSGCSATAAAGRWWTPGSAARKSRSTGVASSRKRPGAARRNGSSPPTSTSTNLDNAGWLAERYGADLRARLGVAVEAALAAPGGTAALTGTGVEHRQKPVRLIHERARPPPAKRARRRS